MLQEVKPNSLCYGYHRKTSRAPHLHDVRQGAGVVYLFLGGVDGVSGHKHGEKWLRAKEGASQLIRAEDFLAPGHIPLPSNFATFGSSLSGGMDLDDNDYPG